MLPRRARGIGPLTNAEGCPQMILLFLIMLCTGDTIELVVLTLPRRYRCSLDWLPASRLLLPRSGLERGDFVLWPFATYCTAALSRSLTNTAEVDGQPSIAEDDARDPEPTLDFASHNTKKRHSRPARSGWLSRPHTSLI